MAMKGGGGSGDLHTVVLLHLITRVLIPVVCDQAGLSSTVKFRFATAHRQGGSGAATYQP